MGSRLKESPDRTFYWFFQASCPIARDKDPGVLFQFPNDFSDEECLQSLPRFCFPFDIERVRDGVAVQHFTFVLTDLEGCQRFGFCRLTSSTQTCLCILSYLPWFEVFYKLLNNLADYLTKGQTNEMQELLMLLYKLPVPMANEPVTLQLIPYFIAPDPKALPSIPESRNLTELVVAVDVGNLMQLYASMLFERRILICCSKLSTLTACVHACAGMLFPMYWQHIFIPVLPPHLLDYCCAPMPYLIGVHSSLIETVRTRALEDVVFLNVDTNTMESPYDDLKRIPSDVVAALKVRLKRQAASAGAGVARAFLRAQAALFGGYREALLNPGGGPVLFSDKLFLTHKSHCMRQFLENSIHLQFFKQFIDARLEMLNQGKMPDDLFEEEIMQCGKAPSDSPKPYQQLVGNLKKGGDALILTVKSRTSSKCSRLKNFIQNKQKEPHCLQRGGSVCGPQAYRLIQSDCLQNRLPITQHFGKSRPRRPVRKPTNQLGEESPEEGSSWLEESHAESGSSGGDVQEDPELELLTDPEEMDLLGEIFDTLNAQSSREPGLLYSTRSLDVFSSDCTDYITRRSLTTPSQESLSLSIGNSGSMKSWEEELEEEPYTEEEGFEVMTDERAVIGAEEVHNTSGEELCVDLGSLIDDLTGLEEELKEEPGDHQPVHEVKEVEQNDGTGTSGWSKDNQTKERSSKDPKPNQTTEEEHDINEDPKDLETPRSDSPQIKESGTDASFSLPENTLPDPSCLDNRHEEEKREESREQSAPRVLSTVAMFQAKVSQTRVSPESARPGYCPTGLAVSLRSSPIGPVQQASNSRPVVNPHTEDHVIKPASTSLTDSEDQDQPSIKVSELKKRFEA